MRIICIESITVICYNANDSHMKIKLTKNRKSILALLQATRGTLSAKEIHQKLPDVDLATVYRNLDLFVKEKLITKVNLDTDESHYEYQQRPHHHAVCTNCNKVLHFSVPEEKIKKLLGLQDFFVEEIEITVRGTCKH